MILFNHIIEVFDLPQFTLFRDESCHFQFNECLWIGRIFVDSDHPWLARMGGSEGFEKEALGCFSIAGWTEEEFQRVPQRIKSTIEVDPFFFHLDVRLVNPPGIACRFQMGTTSPLPSRCLVLDPPIDRALIDREPSFPHDCFQISITQRIAQIVAEAQENDSGLKVTPLEGILALLARERDPLLLVFIHCSRSAFYLQHSRLTHLPDRDGIFSEEVATTGSGPVGKAVLPTYITAL